MIHIMKKFLFQHLVDLLYKEENVIAVFTCEDIPVLRSELNICMLGLKLNGYSAARVTVLVNTGEVRCAKYLSHRSDLRSRTDIYNDS